MMHDASCSQVGKANHVSSGKAMKLQRGMGWQRGGGRHAQVSELAFNVRAHTKLGLEYSRRKCRVDISSDAIGTFQRDDGADHRMQSASKCPQAPTFDSFLT